MKQLIYHNPLSCREDTKDFILEGQGRVSFECGRMRLQSLLSQEEHGQKANIVYWCNQTFPKNIEITWDFWQLADHGLCILFFAALGREGQDIFDPTLTPRTGEYPLYHSGDINALHVSYYRRMWESERAFHVANLRKSHGFHLVAQGADPLPYMADAAPPYHMKLVKLESKVDFFINDLPIFSFSDDGKTYGPVLGEGKIGFRQMSPMIGEYSNLKVYEIGG